MENVEDKIVSMTEKLVNSLKTSEYNVKYQTAKIKIDANPELKNKIHEYKRIHVSTQMKKRNGISISIEEERYVGSLYWDLMLNEDAKNYLESENVLLDMINSVCTQVTRACDIDLSFL